MPKIRDFDEWFQPDMWSRLELTTYEHSRRYMVIQDYFNRAFIGLASQGFARSTVSNAGVDDLVCALRGDGGARCSLGWLVDDADYTPALK